ncbi:FecR family protein [Constantimarinum furrinae]|uniref:FecR family protein n=1 Tax=Constantimarinum furrinae TaxID=2562285 RepID=UPI00164B5EC7|nr:FecR family protein [Constantimarinum furrinae]
MDKNYILHKYLNGEATAEEIAQLKESPEYASYIKISEVTGEFTTPSFDAEGNKKAIDAKIGDPKVRTLSPFGMFIRVAAVVMVLLAGYLYVSTLDTTVNTGIAAKETFLLPDNSEVVLNASSEIVYNKKKWNDNRALALEGEAYFKVEKGSKFSVKTSQGIVSVLGTQFNVFSRDTIFNINCYEGLVSVQFNDTLIKLPAGNKLKIENGTLVVHTQSNTQSPSWITNESSFDNASLATVIEELQRQYPIQITSQNTIVNKRFSGSFTHQDLMIALRSVFDPLQLEFTVEGDQVHVYAPKDK